MIEIGSIVAWMIIVLLVVVFFPAVFLGFCFDLRGRYAHRMIRAWGRAVMKVLRARVHVVGGESLDPQRSYVIVSNHESNVDVMVLLTRLPLDFKFASKRSLLFVPLLGWAMAMGRYVFIRRGQGAHRAKLVVGAMVGKIKQGFSVLLFPEGTRSVDGQMRPFKKGAFHLALETGCDILPCAVVGGREALGKGEWRIRSSDIVLMVGVPHPVPIATSDELQIENLTQSVFNEVAALRQKGKMIFSEKVQTR